MTAADIINNRNVYHVQDNIFAKDKFAHKVIFGDNMYYPGYDIVDWAKTHIGVAYQSHTGLEKNPYRRIECSGLVTATRIQDIGPANNEVYRIGHIEAREWDAGEYNFRGEDLDLQVHRIAAQDVARGDLITFNTWDDENERWVTSHIAIVEDAVFDPSTGWFRYCCIVNARGWQNNRANIRYGRVRYEDLLDDFGPLDYTYRYFRFVN